MTLMNAFILVGITAMFVVFAAVLAWGEHQTRHLNRDFSQKPTTRGELRELVMAQTKLPERRDGEKSVMGSIEREKADG